MTTKSDWVFRAEYLQDAANRLDRRADDLREQAETYRRGSERAAESSRRQRPTSDKEKAVTMMDENQACENTDREIWREREGDYYADAIHVTKSGAIGINCGGYVVVKPIREWFRLACAEPDSPFVMSDNGHVYTQMTEKELLAGLDGLIPKPR